MAADDIVTTDYLYKPSLMGAPWQFRLKAHEFEWQVGQRAGVIAYADIKRLRLSFRPVTMQTQRFQAEIWAAGSPKMQIASCSWKSIVEQERLDRPYAAFITELHRRIAAAGGNARFETGVPPLLYWPGLTVFAAASLAFAALIVRALQVEAWSGAVFIAVFLALFLWQLGTFFHRNRPGRYRPEAIPAEVMPSR